jgi:SAM-dependent methyltransferase
LSVRAKAFAQDYDPSAVDRFGVWLSARQIRRWVPSFAGKRVADVGCGYHATFTRTILGEARQVVLCDVALAPDLVAHPSVTACVGPLSQTLAALPAESVDVVLLISVLEHVWEPLALLENLHRLLTPGGTCLVNVPSWRGKRYLERAAFQWGVSPASEMEDHKMYYDEKDLWPLLVRASFAPSRIRCFSHKFGLNTFAVCTRSPDAATAAGTGALPASAAAPHAPPANGGAS